MAVCPFLFRCSWLPSTAAVGDHRTRIVMLPPLSLFTLSVALNSNFALTVKQATSRLPHRQPRCSYILFQFCNQTPTVTARVAHCVIVGSIFDANQQNKTRLVNMFYYRDVIAIAKLKTWAPCDSRFHSFEGLHSSLTHTGIIREWSLPPSCLRRKPTFIQFEVPS